MKWIFTNSRVEVLMVWHFVKVKQILLNGIMNVGVPMINLHQSLTSIKIFLPLLITGKNVFLFILLLTVSLFKFFLSSMYFPCVLGLGEGKGTGDNIRASVKMTPCQCASHRYNIGAEGYVIENRSGKITFCHSIFMYFKLI